MGYQEILIKSAKISVEDMADIIQRKADPMYIDSADTVAVLRNDFSSNKAVIFGREVDTDKLDFKAGDQFLVVAGERDALKSIKNMFPITQRKAIEIYPMEAIMQSATNLNKEYTDVFDDLKVSATRNQERGNTSILRKLTENKRQIDRGLADKSITNRSDNRDQKKYLDSHDGR